MELDQDQDQAFLEYVVKAIVNHPEDVKSTRTVDERGVLITLDLNPTDMGYVIGRRGQTARAVRTLLKVVGAKNNARVNLKINEPEGGRGPRSYDREERNDHHYNDRRDERREDRPSEAPKPLQSEAPVSSMNLDDIDISAVDTLSI